jgi:hypothetical protein
MNRRDFNSRLIGAGSLLALPLGIAKAKTVAEFKPGPMSVVWYDEPWKPCETRRSGHWRDPATWMHGKVPHDFSTVHVCHPVVVDQNVIRCFIVLRDRGRMKWGRATIEFSFNTVLVQNGGSAMTLEKSCRGTMMNNVFTWVDPAFTGRIS